MKVALFQFYPFTLWTPGGGETLLHGLHAALSQLGVTVDLFDIWNPKRDYDVIHVIGSTHQLSDFVVAATHLGIPVVVSPLANTERPDWQWRLWRPIDRIVPLPTVFTYRKRIYESASMILPCSQQEAAKLHHHFGVSWAKMEVIHNAVERKYTEGTATTFTKQYGLSDFVLMVSRVNSHKGQMRLLQALEGQNLPLVFIGQPDPDAVAFCRELQEMCKSRTWVNYLGHVPKEMLPAAYAAARVHVLPSPGELPGLVSLEAGLAGAAIVVADEPTIHEYLGDEAFYCDPYSVSSIQKAVLRAYNAPRSHGLRERLLAGFTYESVAKDLLRIYQKMITHVQ